MIRKLAGEIGIPPWGSFTLADLFVMQEGADFARWNHTTAIQATMANTVRDAKKRSKPFSGREFHPHILHAEAEKKKRGDVPQENKVSITILRDIFVDGTPWNEVEIKHDLQLRE